MRDVVASPRYLDVTLPAGGAFIWDGPFGLTVFATMAEGKAGFGEDAPLREPVAWRGPIVMDSWPSWTWPSASSAPAPS